MKQFVNISLLAITLGMSACGGGGGSRPKTAAEIFVENLNYSDAYKSYYLTKDPTHQYGYIVVETGTGSYRAIDITSAYRWGYTSDYAYFWDNSFTVWNDGNGYFSDIWGNLYEDAADAAKDLEKVGAIIQKARVQDIGEQLSANYGLSETRGIEVAKLLVDWKTLQKKRSLTDADADAFSEKLLGFSLTDAMKAYDKFAQGDKADMDKLVDEAARNNDTSPEHLRDLFGEILNK